MAEAAGGEAEGMNDPASQEDEGAAADSEGAASPALAAAATDMSPSTEAAAAAVVAGSARLRTEGKLGQKGIAAAYTMRMKRKKGRKKGIACLVGPRECSSQCAQPSLTGCLKVSTVQPVIHLARFIDHHTRAPSLAWQQGLFMTTC